MPNSFRIIVHVYPKPGRYWEPFAMMPGHPERGYSIFRPFRRLRLMAALARKDHLHEKADALA